MKQPTPENVFRVVADKDGIRSICLLCFLTIRPRGQQSLEEAERNHEAVCVPLPKSAVRQNSVTR